MQMITDSELPTFHGPSCCVPPYHAPSVGPSSGVPPARIFSAPQTNPPPPLHAFQATATASMPSQPSLSSFTVFSDSRSNSLNFPAPDPTPILSHLPTAPSFAETQLSSDSVKKVSSFVTSVISQAVTLSSNLVNQTSFLQSIQHSPSSQLCCPICSNCGIYPVALQYIRTNTQGHSNSSCKPNVHDPLNFGRAMHYFRRELQVPLEYAITYLQRSLRLRMSEVITGALLFEQFCKQHWRCATFVLFRNILKTIFIVCMIIAHKTSADECITNKCWARTVNLGLEVLNEYEKDILAMLDYHVVVDPSRYSEFTGSVVAPGTQSAAAQLYRQFNAPEECDDSEISSSSQVTPVNVSPASSPAPTSATPNCTPSPVYNCGSSSMGNSPFAYPQASPFGPVAFSPYCSSPSTTVPSQLLSSPSPKQSPSLPGPAMSTPPGQFSFAPRSPIAEAQEALTPLPGAMMSSVGAWLEQKPIDIQTRGAPHLPVPTATQIQSALPSNSYTTGFSGGAFNTPQFVHA